MYETTLKGSGQGPLRFPSRTIVYLNVNTVFEC